MFLDDVSGSIPMLDGSKRLLLLMLKPEPTSGYIIVSGEIIAPLHS
jgi:hypothetical protein